MNRELECPKMMREATHDHLRWMWLHVEVVAVWISVSRYLYKSLINEPIESLVKNSSLDMRTRRLCMVERRLR